MSFVARWRLPRPALRHWRAPDELSVTLNFSEKSPSSVSEANGRAAPEKAGGRGNRRLSGAAALLETYP